MSNNLLDYIVVVDNIVPPELCDALLNEYSAESAWQSGLTKAGLDLSSRNVEELGISERCVIDKNATVRNKLDDELFSCAGKAVQAYQAKFPRVSVQTDSGYRMLRYSIGGFYAQHTDSCAEHNRTMSCSFALNDDYDGGEWRFFDRSVGVKAPKGSAVMFPSNFMYPHEITPVTKGCRYAVVTWFV
jgi:predicted 2-oxoglutarate/Fe(II)-dependent dioxygenase YbiX